MRARYPDTAGQVVRDGVRLGYEVFGAGEPTVLLLPTWTIVHSRIWKMQVPYLSRHYRVVTYDGPGNGRSDRVTQPDRYSPDAYAEDAVAVLDEIGAERVVAVGLSLGAAYGTRLANLHPERVAGLVMIAPALPLTPPSPERARAAERFLEPYPEQPRGWEKYNAAYWRDHYEKFASFFFKHCLPESHSTKPREDAVAWALGTDPDVLVAEAGYARLDQEEWAEALAAISAPTLVVHGTEDRIHPHARGVEAARLTGGRLLSMEGSGHLPNLRDPVRFNLELHGFLQEVGA
jgi:pimeloyl-ACP methyl ester carboxylesterase